MELKLLNNQAIGVFDSGLGGLTCVKEIMEILPCEDVIYFGDTGRVPYGTRSEKTIIKYVEGDINFLSSFDVKVIVIACGTASAIALNHAKEKYNFPIMGVVDPASKMAAAATKNGRIGVIGTPITIKSDKYRQTLLSVNKDFFVESVPCRMFVPLVEAGYINHEATRIIAAEYLAPLKEKNIDTLILGCTHYPLLKDVINDFFDGKVTLIDSGYAAGIYLDNFLKTHDMQNEPSHKGEYNFYVSDSIQDFEKLGGMFLNREIAGVTKKIDIERY